MFGLLYIQLKHSRTINYMLGTIQKNLWKRQNLFIMNIVLQDSLWLGFFLVHFWWKQSQILFTNTNIVKDTFVLTSYKTFHRIPWQLLSHCVFEIEWKLCLFLFQSYSRCNLRQWQKTLLDFGRKENYL